MDECSLNPEPSPILWQQMPAKDALSDHERYRRELWIKAFVSGRWPGREKLSEAYLDASVAVNEFDRFFEERPNGR